MRRAAATFVWAGGVTMIVTACGTADERSVTISEPLETCDVPTVDDSQVATMESGKAPPRKPVVTREEYVQCFGDAFDALFVCGKWEGAVHIPACIGLEGGSSADQWKSCMRAVCDNKAMIATPPCVAFRAGLLAEACLKVLVGTVAGKILPATMDKLINGWDGLDCKTMSNKASCNLCCRDTNGGMSDANRYLDCLQGCNDKPDLVK